MLYQNGFFLTEQLRFHVNKAKEKLIGLHFTCGLAEGDAG
ncbi:hypothetical protein CHCC20335_4418 [Bacillus paralicheniformis]|nr:hypothetical protein CHCC20335_4418 [Bacillus paralicheniformis]